MMTSLVKGSIVDFPVALTEGLNSVPSLYGEKVRQRKPITDWKSGSKEAGKNFVNGFADPIWCLFKQPAVGLTKHGGLGLLTGLGKAGMGLVVKPGSGKRSFLCVNTSFPGEYLPSYAILLTLDVSSYVRSFRVSCTWYLSIHCRCINFSGTSGYLASKSNTRRFHE